MGPAQVVGRCHGLAGAYLVVGRLKAARRDARGGRGGLPGGVVDSSEVVDRDGSGRRLLVVPRPLRRGDDRRVLDRAVHHGSADPEAADPEAEDAYLAGRARGDEGHLVGSGADDRRHHLARVVEQQTGLATLVMMAQRVGPPVRHRGFERVARSGHQGQPGGRIEKHPIRRCRRLAGRAHNTTVATPTSRVVTGTPGVLCC